MSGDLRNTRVTISLIAAMTLGAVLLLALGPTRTSLPTDRLLLADRSAAVTSVVIGIVPYGEAISRFDFDAVILADGQNTWHRRERDSGKLLIALQGTLDETLPDAQAQRLLELLGSLHRLHGVPLGVIRLDPDTDVRFHAHGSPQAHALLELLVRKGVLR